jgi:hypothetical protein
MFKISAPTKDQVIHGVERTVAVFVVTAITTWHLNGDQFSKAALWAAGLAGATAVYQVLVSSFTTL